MYAVQLLVPGRGGALTEQLLVQGEGREEAQGQPTTYVHSAADTATVGAGGS